MAKKVSNAKQEQIRLEDGLDNRLYEALEVMAKPVKLGMDKDNNFVTLYPLPVFKGTKVIRTEYKTTKAVELPEELFERLCILEDEIEALAPKKRGRKPMDATTADVCRPYKYTPETIQKWFELREQGLSYKEIAEATGAKHSTVGNYIKKYNRKQVKEAV